MMIQEFLFLAGEIAATFADDKNLPFLYRKQGWCYVTTLKAFVHNIIHLYAHRAAEGGEQLFFVLDETTQHGF